MLLMKLESYRSCPYQAPKQYYIYSFKIFYPFDNLPRYILHYRSKTHFSTNKYLFLQKYVNLGIRNNLKAIEMFFEKHKNFFGNFGGPKWIRTSSHSEGLACQPTYWENSSSKCQNSCTVSKFQSKWCIAQQP